MDIEKTVQQDVDNEESDKASIKASDKKLSLKKNEKNNISVGINNKLNRRQTGYLAAVVIFMSVIILPINLRHALFSGGMEDYAYINLMFLIGFAILYKIKEESETIDILFTIICMIAVSYVLVSNYDMPTYRTVIFILNCIFPAVFITMKFDRGDYKKIFKVFLIAFDVFVIILLINAIVDKVTGNAILILLAEATGSEELGFYLVSVEANRFYSLWGHALTNAVIFNAFYILNDSYFRSIRGKFPKLIFFLAALGGVLLCASKTALVVLVVYFLISCRNKWIYLGGVIGTVILFFSGVFKSVINRFTTMSLTSGRMEAFNYYLQSGIKPLESAEGYGTGTVFTKSMVGYKPGFELPFLMFSLDYGIAFAVIWLVGIYAFASYQILRNKQYTTWIGFSLIYAEINTYNGICLMNHDVAILFFIFIMLMINNSRLEEVPVKTKRRKKTDADINA